MGSFVRHQRGLEAEAFPTIFAHERFLSRVGSLVRSQHRTPAEGLPAHATRLLALASAPPLNDCCLGVPVPFHTRGACFGPASLSLFLQSVVMAAGSISVLLMPQVCPGGPTELGQLWILQLKTLVLPVVKHPLDTFRVGLTITLLLDVRAKLLLSRDGGGLLNHRKTHFLDQCWTLSPQVPRLLPP